MAAPLATRASEVTRNLAMMARASVLGALTIPDAPSTSARRAPLWRRPSAKPIRATDMAVLLVSETVTNAVLHSNSRHPGGTVTITVIEIGGGCGSR